MIFNKVKQNISRNIDIACFHFIFFRLNLICWKYSHFFYQCTIAVKCIFFLESEDQKLEREWEETDVAVER